MRRRGNLAFRRVRVYGCAWRCGNRWRCLNLSEGKLMEIVDSLGETLLRYHML